MNRSNLLTGLLGYWSFEEQTGSIALDSSGKSNHATWAGSLGSQWGVGKLGGAGVFNGTNNYVSCPATRLPAGSTSRSLSLWVKSTQAWNSTYPTLVAYGAMGTNTAATVVCMSSTNNHSWQISNWGLNITASKTIDDGLWHHVSFSFDGTTYRLYTDGVADGSGTMTTATTVAGTTFYAGYGGSPSQANYIAATLDEVGIWGKAFTPIEVTQLYNCGVGYQLPL